MEYNEIVRIIECVMEIKGFNLSLRMSSECFGRFFFVFFVGGCDGVDAEELGSLGRLRRLEWIQRCLRRIFSDLLLMLVDGLLRRCYYDQLLLDQFID